MHIDCHCGVDDIHSASIGIDDLLNFICGGAARCQMGSNHSAENIANIPLDDDVSRCLRHLWVLEFPVIYQYDILPQPLLAPVCVLWYLTEWHGGFVAYCCGFSAMRSVCAIQVKATE